MNFVVFKVDPDSVSLWHDKSLTAEDVTGIKPTDIFGLLNKDGSVTVSAETWKRIMLFAEILSAVDMSISQEKLNEILGGKKL